MAVLRIVQLLKSRKLQAIVCRETMLRRKKQGIIDNAAACDANSSAIQDLCSKNLDSILCDDFRLTGVEAVDLEAEELLLNREVFEEYAAFERVLYEQLQKNRSVLAGLERDFVGAMDKLTMLKYDDSLGYSLRALKAYFKQGLGHSMRALYFPNYTDAECITADISVYAAILQNTDEPQLAYDFIRFGMDVVPSHIAQDLPVSKAAVASAFSELQNNPGIKTNLGSKQIQIPVMDMETQAECEEILNKISAGSIRNYAVESIIAETMGPYMRGETDDFDSCFTKLKNQLSIYIYE